MTNPDMANMPDHHPRRGDQIEAWIRDRREEFDGRSDSRADEAFTALDNLLDEYREAADTGRSLDEVVNGDHERPERGAPKKPKKFPRSSR